MVSAPEPASVAATSSAALASTALLWGQQKGAPVELVFPKEGLGWDLEAAGIMKNTKKMDAAKKLMDWVATKEANEAFSKRAPT